MSHFDQENENLGLYPESEGVLNVKGKWNFTNQDKEHKKQVTGLSFCVSLCRLPFSSSSASVLLKVSCNWTFFVVLIIVWRKIEIACKRHASRKDSRGRLCVFCVFVWMSDCLSWVTPFRSGCETKGAKLPRERIWLKMITCDFFSHFSSHSSHSLIDVKVLLSLPFFLYWKESNDSLDSFVTLYENQLLVYDCCRQRNFNSITVINVSRLVHFLSRFPL